MASLPLATVQPQSELEIAGAASTDEAVADEPSTADESTTFASVLGFAARTSIAGSCRLSRHAATKRKQARRRGDRATSPTSRDPLPVSRLSDTEERPAVREEGPRDRCEDDRKHDADQD